MPQPRWRKWPIGCPGEWVKGQFSPWALWCRRQDCEPGPDQPALAGAPRLAPFWPRTGEGARRHHPFPHCVRGGLAEPRRRMSPQGASGTPFTPFPRRPPLLAVAPPAALPSDRSGRRVGGPCRGGTRDVRVGVGVERSLRVVCTRSPRRCRSCLRFRCVPSAHLGVVLAPVVRLCGEVPSGSASSAYLRLPLFDQFPS